MKSVFFIHLIITALFMVGCSSTYSEKPPVEQRARCEIDFVEAIYDSRGHRSNFMTVIRQAASADYVLVGEVHTNTRHHDIQTRVVGTTVMRQPRFKTVRFEMLEPSHDEAATAFHKGTASISDLKTALRWSERGWPIWDAYARLFEAAKISGLKIGHAGMDSELVRHVNNFGFLALPRRMREDLGLKKDSQPVIDLTSLKAEVAQAHAADKAASQRLALSQYAKDAYMARQLASERSGALLIAGNGHVRLDIGVPAHLRKYHPAAQIVSIGLLEGSGRQELRQLVEQNGRKLYDFVWLTSNPCEANLAK